MGMLQRESPGKTQSNFTLLPSAFSLCFLLAEFYQKLESKTDIGVALKIGPWSTKQDGESKCEWELVLYIWNDTTARNSMWENYNKKGLRPVSSLIYLEQRSQSDNL